MRSRGRLALVLGLVLLATALVHLRALSGELVYDDLLMVGRNPDIADLGNVPRLFPRAYWDFLGTEEASRIPYWRPLTAVALALAWRVGAGEPWAFHALSLLVHLGATAAAFLLARRLSGSVWVAGATALVFGLHPVHVESVAWITALNDPLFGLFALLALHAFLRWRDRGSRGVPLVAALFLVPALLAKELALSVVPLCMALDLGRRRRPAERDEPHEGLFPFARAYAPFGAVLLVYYAARTVVFASPLAGFDRTITDFGVGFGRLLWLRVEILGGAVGLLVWPSGLNVFRPFRPVLAPTDPALWAAIGWTLALGALAAWLWRRRARAALAGVLAIPAGLLPILASTGSLGLFPLSDRFLYLPVFGFGLALAVGLRRLLAPRLAVAALLLVGSAHAVLSFQRVGVWRDEETLFRSAAAASPRSPYVLWGLGRVLLQRYRETDEPRYLEEAQGVYERAGDLLIEARRPDSDVFVSSRDYLQTNLGLGWVHLLRERTDPFQSYGTSIAIFEELSARLEALRERELHAESLGIRVRSDHLELEQVYTALGVARAAAGASEAAEESFERALASNPRYPEAHQNLGRLLFERGEWRAARHHFERALAERPGSLEDRLLLAQALVSEGLPERARELALELERRMPERSEAPKLLAAIELAHGDAAGALRWIERALEIDPRDGSAWHDKGLALIQLGREQRAADALANATRLAPGDCRSHYVLGALLLNSGKADAAVPYLVRAYALCGQRPDLLDLLRETLGTLELVPEAQVELAGADFARRDLDRADAWLDAALAQTPELGPALLLRGRILSDRGRDAEATDALRRAAAILDDSFLAHSELGLLLVRTGQADQALRHLERALELEPPPEWQPGMVQAVQETIRRRIEELRSGGPPPSDGE